jgi:hypothetical protein
LAKEISKNKLQTDDTDKDTDLPPVRNVKDTILIKDSKEAAVSECICVRGLLLNLFFS